MTFCVENTNEYTKKLLELINEFRNKLYSDTLAMNNPNRNLKKIPFTIASKNKILSNESEETKKLVH